MIFTIFTMSKMLGEPVIGNLPRGLPKPRRCIKNLILEILQILQILLMICKHLVPGRPEHIERHLVSILKEGNAPQRDIQANRRNQQNASQNRIRIRFLLIKPAAEERAEDTSQT